MAKIVKHRNSRSSILGPDHRSLRPRQKGDEARPFDSAACDMPMDAGPSPLPAINLSMFGCLLDLERHTSCWKQRLHGAIFGYHSPSRSFLLSLEWFSKANCLHVHTRDTHDRRA